MSEYSLPKNSYIVCCCSMAGTEACWTCSNNPNRIQTGLPIFIQPDWQTAPCPPTFTHSHTTNYMKLSPANPYIAWDSYKKGLIDLETLFEQLEASCDITI
jgi:hypothetical protein